MDATAICVIVIALFGLVINAMSLFILQCYRRNMVSSQFHHLLKLLAVSDSFVVTGCALLYGLPGVLEYYRVFVHPVIVPWLVPCTQIAIMVSVYCTVVMSYERYVRICFLCQLRGLPRAFLTQDNFKW